MTVSSSNPNSQIPSQSLGDGLSISGGQFNQFQAQNIYQHNDNSTRYTNNLNISRVKAGFELLQDHVATAAFHNSAQRIDPPRCHPNTREEVMRKIMEWILGNEDRDAWIAWLNGAAGAGKTAIAQSIAERCVSQGITVASFFFFRTDPTRNTSQFLVATLAYQILRNIPETRKIIVNAIDHDPLIFEQSLEDQVNILILKPLRRIGRYASSNGSSPVLLIIDGLDECNNHGVQANIVRTLSTSLGANKDIPLRLLVASRPESHLSAVFNSGGVICGLSRVVLNADQLADNDIRLFLNDKFAEITATHPLKHLLDPTWSALNIIEEIVEKSSGQFIYASVVVSYVSSPSAHPAQHLEVIRGLRPARSDTPFAELDALYSYIFSQVPDLKSALTVLAMALSGVSRVRFVEQYLGSGHGGVELSLSSLTSIVVVSGNRIKFHHASLPDFLRDPERSKQYYINPVTWGTELAILWFRAAEKHKLFLTLKGDGCSFVDFTNFLAVNNMTPSQELCTKVSDFVFTWDNMWWGGYDDISLLEGINRFLSALKLLDLGDHGKTYRHQCSSARRLIQFHSYHIGPPSLHEMRTSPDIHDIYTLTGSPTTIWLKRLRRHMPWWIKHHFHQLE